MRALNIPIVVKLSTLTSHFYYTVNRNLITLPVSKMLAFAHCVWARAQTIVISFGKFIDEMCQKTTTPHSAQVGKKHSSKHTVQYIHSVWTMLLLVVMVMVMPVIIMCVNTYFERQIGSSISYIIYYWRLGFSLNIKNLLSLSSSIRIRRYGRVCVCCVCARARPLPNNL